MEHILRFAQRNKPVLPTEQYGDLLSKSLQENQLALEALDRGSTNLYGPYYDHPGRPLMLKPGLEWDSFQATMAAMSDRFDSLDERRLELEAIRPEERLSTVHLEAVKLIRCSLERINHVASHVRAIAEHDRRKIASAEENIRIYADIAAKISDNLRAALVELQQRRGVEFDRLALDYVVLASYGLTTNTPDQPTARHNHGTIGQAKGGLPDINSDGGGYSLEAIRLVEGRTSGNDADPFLKAFAKNLRVREMCRQHGVFVPADLRPFDRLMEELRDMAQKPQTWLSVDSKSLRIFAFERIFQYGLTNNTDDIGLLARLYSVLNSRLSQDQRALLVADISLELNASDVEVNALLPFMQMDQSLPIVSMAAMNFAVIHPATPNDPLEGPRACLALAQELSGGDAYMSVGILQGLILLGDMRVVELIEGCWDRLSFDYQCRLGEAWSGAWHAAIPMFWLRWLEAAPEAEMGNPARALSRFGSTVGHQQIHHIERRFPSPFTPPDEEVATSPPIRRIRSWLRSDFARFIEPRLRLITLRETYDKLAPEVMREWGLEPGPDSKDFQLEQVFSSYTVRCERLRSLGSGSEHSEAGPRSPEVHARELIASMFRKNVPGLALSLCLEFASGMLKLAEKLERESHGLATARERQEEIEKAQRYFGKATTIQNLLIQELGPDLSAVVREFVAIGQLGGHDYLPN